MFNPIALSAILADEVPRLAAFQRDVLLFGVKPDMGAYSVMTQPDICLTET